MVIYVYAEGGAIGEKHDAETMDNTAAFREELHKLYNKAIGLDDITVKVFPSGGYKNAAKVFAASADSTPFLYTDLDRKPEKRDDWFSDMAVDGICIPEGRRGNVFFWIQEMEAWFLKQPDAIEEWGKEEGFQRKRRAVVPISEHESIKGKDIEMLQHKPSAVLHDILRQTFENPFELKKGKPTPVLYGKLKHAPDLISHLDATLLLANDSELRAFRDRVLAISSQD